MLHFSGAFGRTLFCAFPRFFSFSPNSTCSLPIPASFPLPIFITIPLLTTDTSLRSPSLCEAEKDCRSGNLLLFSCLFTSPAPPCPIIYCYFFSPRNSSYISPTCRAISGLGISQNMRIRGSVPENLPTTHPPFLKYTLLPSR